MSEPLAAGFPALAERSKSWIVSVAAGLRALCSVLHQIATLENTMLRHFDLNLLFTSDFRPLVMFGLLTTGSQAGLSRRTPRRPFHPSGILTEVSAINGAHPLPADTFLSAHDHGRLPL